MVAVRVVLAQEEGFGNECHDDPSYTELHDDLTTFLSQNPLGKLWDGEWLEKLIRHPKLNCRLAAVRIIEVQTCTCPKSLTGVCTRVKRSMTWTSVIRG